MNRLGRREFLATAAAAALFPLRGRAGFTPGLTSRQTALSYEVFDPTRPFNFSQSLLLPADHGPFGILEPTASFTLTAGESRHELFPGTLSALNTYAVELEGRAFTDPIIHLRNGDSLDVQLRNELTDPTIVHWHGLRVDGKNDAHVSFAIPAKGSYRYDFPILNRAGAYWYHPHPHGFTARQVYLGLAGLFIVDDDEELALRNNLDLRLGETDIPLVLQDKQFSSEGELIYDPNTADRMMGFLGDVIFVNLTPKPVLDLQGRIYRFRILNGSNARIYRLAFVKGTTPIPLMLIGNDGGLLEQPIEITEIFLAPGERADVLLDARRLDAGDVFFLKSLAFNPMHNEMHGFTPGQQSSRLAEGEEFYIMQLNVQAATSYDRVAPSRLSEIRPILTGGAASRRFDLALSMGGPTGGRRWTINRLTYNMEEYPVSVSRGAIEIWEIVNSPMSMPHPIHIHGFPFQVISRTGSPNQISRLVAGPDGLVPSDRGWKDTVLVWPGERVRLAIDFAHNFPGRQPYLFHCHNLEHEDQGMMINYEVT
ncbi:MAG: multicopper oxidase domain-containing protein [Acidobacteria bacterium]|nr:multicopper oxidase domain-containing protein [Acidobacteriota bacterium]